MKTPLSLIAILLVAATFLSGCRDRVYKTYNANVPIYLSYEDWRALDVELEESRDPNFPGKIYIYNDLLFVNDVFQGIHVYNYSDPANPVAIGFIGIPGNIDLAIRDGFMYADSYYDLLIIDISNIQNPHVVGRVEDAFDFDSVEAIPGLDSNYPVAEWNEDKGVVLGWKIESVTIEDYPNYYYPNIDVFAVGSTLETAIAHDPSISSVGIGGSMAQFSIYHDNLYTVEETALTTYDLTNPENPTVTDEEQITLVAETIFPAQEHLFIGTQNGMLIYSLSNPNDPSWVSTYDHVVSCDPVVVDGDYAYVTLATGRQCWMGINQLEVIDISNLSNPTLLREFEMNNPQGLGVDQNTLFLCDNGAGLKVFDITDPLSLDQHQLATFPEIDTYDVIPYQDVLIMVGGNGIRFYDYSDVQNIYLVSTIDVQ